MRTNQVVTTPLGLGVIQGRFEGGWLVRIPVNDTTRKQLGKSLTPHANASGLWVMPETQLKAAT